MSTAFLVSEDRCASERYSQRVNPEWVRLLNLLEMNVCYERGVGAEWFPPDGTRIVDFLSDIAFWPWDTTIRTCCVRSNVNSSAALRR